MSAFAAARTAVRSVCSGLAATSRFSTKTSPFPISLNNNPLSQSIMRAPVGMSFGVESMRSYHTKGQDDKEDNSKIPFMSALDFHYEDVLRHDLLLKLNYENIMEIPQLREVRIVQKASHDVVMKNGKFAMEVLSGQRFTETQKSTTGKSSNPYMNTGRKGAIVEPKKQSTIRGQAMSEFLLRTLTVMSLLDTPVEIKEKYIQFLMDTEFCEFSPELEDHFDMLEHIQGFRVNIVTTAKTQAEASLLWSGIFQKDEGETQ